MTINVSVSGTDSIDKDFIGVTKRITAAITKAVPAIADGMGIALKQRIEEDVYRKYNPSVYPRRSAPGGTAFGTPLNDMEANTSYGITPDGKGMYFEYLPGGSNSATTANLRPGNKYYNADKPTPIKPPDKAVHGDDLIRRIETGTGYDWKANMKARPFWHNFVEKLFETGYLEVYIVEAFRQAGVEDISPLIGSLERSSGDGDY